MSRVATATSAPHPARAAALVGLLEDHRRGVLLLLVLTMVLFGSASWHRATLDGQHFLVDDVRVREFRLGELVTTGYWHHDPGDPTHTTGVDLYRPLTLVWMSAWWQLSSREQRDDVRPVLLNMANVALHAASVVLRFWWLLLLLGGRPRRGAIAFLAALLLAVHPVATEAVATQVGAAEGLVAVCGTAALLCWHRWQCRGTRHGALGFAVWLLLALMAKETAVTIAAIAPIGTWMLLRRSWRQCARVALAAAVPVALWFALHLLVTGSAVAVQNPVLAGFSPADARLTAVAAVGGYDVPALLWPFRLLAVVGYQALWPPAGFGDARVLAGLGATAAWLLALVLVWRRDRIAAFGLLFFAVTLLPASNLLVPFGSLAATRFLYLPMTGLALAFAIGIDRLAKGVQPALRRLAVGLMLAVPAVFAVATLREVPVWSSQAKLLRTMAGRMPDLYFLSNLGAALLPEIEAAVAAGDEPRAQALRDQALAAFAAGLAAPRPHVPGIDAIPENLLLHAYQCCMAQAIAHKQWNADLQAAGRSGGLMLELARQGTAQSAAVHGEVQWSVLESQAECLLAEIGEQRAQGEGAGDVREALLHAAMQHVERARQLAPDRLDADEQWLQIAMQRGSETELRNAYAQAYARARPRLAEQTAAVRIAIGYARYLEHRGERERALAVALEALVEGRERLRGAAPFFDYGVRGMGAADAGVRQLARAALQIFVQRAGEQDAASVRVARQLLERGP